MEYDAPRNLCSRLYIDIGTECILTNFINFISYNENLYKGEFYW